MPVYLKALLGSKSGFTVGTGKRLGSNVYEHMLLQIRLLGKLFWALWARVLLSSIVNFFNMTRKSIFGAENEFAVYTMKLFGFFVYLLDVLFKGLWIQIYLSTCLHIGWWVIHKRRKGQYYSKMYCRILISICSPTILHVEHGYKYHHSITFI